MDKSEDEVKGSQISDKGNSICEDTPFFFYKAKINLA